MPQIWVTADAPQDWVMLSERVTVDDFQSEYLRARLVERLGWGVGDADALEQADGRTDG